jgi:hypothetical protein
LAGPFFGICAIRSKFLNQSWHLKQTQIQILPRRPQFKTNKLNSPALKPSTKATSSFFLTNMDEDDDDDEDEDDDDIYHDEEDEAENDSPNPEDILGLLVAEFKSRNGHDPSDEVMKQWQHALREAVEGTQFGGSGGSDTGNRCEIHPDMTHGHPCVKMDEVNEPFSVVFPPVNLRSETPLQCNPPMNIINFSSGIAVSSVTTTTHLPPLKFDSASRTAESPEQALNPFNFSTLGIPAALSISWTPPAAIQERVRASECGGGGGGGSGVAMEQAEEDHAIVSGPELQQRSSFSSTTAAPVGASAKAAAFAAPFAQATSPAKRSREEPAARPSLLSTARSTRPTTLGCPAAVAVHGLPENAAEFRGIYRPDASKVRECGSKLSMQRRLPACGVSDYFSALF